MKLLRRSGTLHLSRRHALSATLGCVLLAAFALPAAAQERSMVDVVMRTFDTAGRQVYFVPQLLQEDTGPRPVNAVIRHAPQTIREVEQTFRAKVMTPEEAVRCEDPDRRETCSLPGNGIMFLFMMRGTLQNQILPVRVIVYHDGKGEGGGILREMWDYTLRRMDGIGWRVVNRQLVATAQGPW